MESNAMTAVWDMASLVGRASRSPADTLPWIRPVLARVDYTEEDVAKLASKAWLRLSNLFPVLNLVNLGMVGKVLQIANFCEIQGFP